MSALLGDIQDVRSRGATALNMRDQHGPKGNSPKTNANLQLMQGMLFDSPDAGTSVMRQTSPKEQADLPHPTPHIRNRDQH